MNDEKLKYFGSSRKDPSFKGVVQERPIGRNCLKSGLGQFSDLRGDLARNRGVAFLRGSADTLMHTMLF